MCRSALKLVLAKDFAPWDWDEEAFAKGSQGGVGQAGSIKFIAVYIQVPNILEVCRITTLNIQVADRGCSPKETYMSSHVRVVGLANWKRGRSRFYFQSQAEYHQFEINALKAELEQLKLEQSQIPRISQVSFGSLWQRQSWFVWEVLTWKQFLLQTLQPRLALPCWHPDERHINHLAMLRIWGFLHFLDKSRWDKWLRGRVIVFAKAPCCFQNLRSTAKLRILCDKNMWQKYVFKRGCLHLPTRRCLARYCHVVPQEIGRRQKAKTIFLGQHA